MPSQEEAERHAPNPTEIRVLSVGKSLKRESFKIPENSLEVGLAWREWIEDFKDETLYFKITEIRDHVSTWKIYDGKEIKKLAFNLPDTVPVVGDDDFKKLKRKLDNHFLPKKFHARFTFNKQKQILEHLIQTIKDSKLIEGSIQKKWNLNQFLEEAKEKISIRKSKT